ncbi:MAG: hypothetical protein HRT35_16380 [Algicola sp.]|nr:hypothetical protein [Algicola sp.]
MTTINGAAGFGMNPVQMRENSQDRFASADIDASGALSKDEFLANAPENAPASILDKVFARMDADGNGEVSAQEQQSMIDEMSERMKNRPKPGESASYANVDTFKVMLESLANNEEDSAKSSAIEDLLAKLEEQGYDKQSMAKSMATINNMYPKVDTKA